MALFKIFNNFGTNNAINPASLNHTAGYCYFDKTTGKFWVDTGSTAAEMLQLGGTFYGTCTTFGNIGAKVVGDCPGFTLYTGASIYVKFAETNSASVETLTLNVNNTGAYAIKKSGTTSLNREDAIKAGLVVNFVYDGTNWLWTGQMASENTTGAADSSSKLYLIGATTQSDDVQTYSHDTVYVDTDGGLYAPTATSGTSTTQVATTEFVMDIVGDIATILASI